MGEASGSVGHVSAPEFGGFGPDHLRVVTGAEVEVVGLHAGRVELLNFVVPGLNADGHDFFGGDFPAAARLIHVLPHGESGHVALVVVAEIALFGPSTCMGC